MSNDGGLAFPFTWYSKDSTGEVVPRESHPGMTLRDYFAGQALAGMISLDHPATPNITAQEFAKSSYQMADAMLREKMRTDEQPSK